MVSNVPNLVTVGAGEGQGLGEGTMDMPGLCTAYHSARLNIEQEEPLVWLSSAYDCVLKITTSLLLI